MGSPKQQTEKRRSSATAGWSKPAYAAVNCLPKRCTTPCSILWPSFATANLRTTPPSSWWPFHRSPCDSPSTVESLLTDANFCSNSVREVTHREIAEGLHLYRESITSALGGLRKAGIIAIGTKCIRIVDRSRLERASCE